MSFISYANGVVLNPEPDVTDIELDDDSDGEYSTRSSVFEWAVVIVSAVVFALLLRTFVVAAFWIPSGSMEPTLEINDRVLVNKLSYTTGEISRGDIVVIRREEVLPGQTKDLIKRVVAFSGESIEVREDTVFIDGEPIDESDYLADNVPEDDFGPFEVPEGTIFVLGDNRSNSDDSAKGLGPVNEEQVVGRAFVRFWPLNRAGGL